MSKASKQKKRGDNWKAKAIQRGAENRALRKEQTRLAKERDTYKARAVEAEKKYSDMESQSHLPALSNKVNIVFIILLLFGVACIGFRSISRVLGVLRGYLGIEKVPCPQTISNYVFRLAIARMHYDNKVYNAQYGSGYIWTIDASIALGSGKILAVLAVRSDHHKFNEKAITLKDAQCVAVAVAPTWTGESIAEFLRKVIMSIGCPDGILKDAGKDIAKGVGILEGWGFLMASISDLSHFCANLLKQEYAKHPLFDTFISACGTVSKNLKQTILACLAPPKVSTKARFMNLHRLVMWAYKLLQHSLPGGAAKGSMLERLRRSLDNLPDCKAFIQRFKRDASILLKIQEILKNKGISHQTVRESKGLLNALPDSSSVRKGMAEWLDWQLGVAQKLSLDHIGMPITSDHIESLFGVAKNRGAATVKDANLIAARIPALCGTITPEDAKAVLNVSVRDQLNFFEDISSLVKQRRQILPNPGNLEALAGADCHNLEMILGTKIGEKNQFKYNKSDCCEKGKGSTTQAKNGGDNWPKQPQMGNSGSP